MAPVWDPSPADSEAADRFVSRLLEFWPDPEQFSLWGRQFGSLAAHAHGHDHREQGSHLPIAVFFLNYSCRRAMAGSTLVARRPGTRHANRATPIIVRATMVNVAGSVGWMP